MIHSTQLCFQYPGGRAIHFPDVALPQGGVMLLRGASGTGKSTWLALAAGLLQAQSGELLVAGQDPSTLGQRAVDAWRARSIGFLPQRLHLSEALTVRQNLELALFAAGRPRDSGLIGAALGALGVADLDKRRPAQISGGQALRVALARSLLLAPQVLLADEPTASLDDAAAEAAVHLLRSHASRVGASLVIATHDARVVGLLPEAVHFKLE